MNEKEAEAIARRVVEEVRALFLTAAPREVSDLPTPEDRDAERVVLAAIVTGERAPSAYPFLHAGDFRVPIYESIFAGAIALEAAGKRSGSPEADLPTITRLLRQTGAVLRGLEDVFADLCELEPRADVDDLAERVHELGCRRRTIDLWQQIEACWRLGVDPSPPTLQKLIVALSRWFP